MLTCNFCVDRICQLTAICQPLPPQWLIKDIHTTRGGCVCTWCVCVFLSFMQTMVSYWNDIKLLSSLLCLFPLPRLPLPLLHPILSGSNTPLPFYLNFYYFLPLFFISSFHSSFLCRSSSLFSCLAQDYVGECFNCIRAPFLVLIM